MTAKVKPSEIKTKQLEELFSTEGILALKDLLKAGMEKILQEALEGEATDFLGARGLSMCNKISICTLYRLNCEPPIKSKNHSASTQNDTDDHRRCNLKRKPQYALEIGSC